MANTTVKEGDVISVHYEGKLKNGEKFDSSYDRGQPITFKAGAGQMIKGFDAGVIGMEQGEKKTIEITPEEGYGYPREDLIVTVPTEQFGQIPDEYKEGDYIVIQTNNGYMEALLLKKDDKEVKLNLNHRLAGETLVFNVEIMEIGVKEV